LSFLLQITMFTRLGILTAAALASSACQVEPPPPPVVLPKGGRVTYNGRSTYWDRNGDRKPDRLRIYWGSGYAREYFDDNYDGTWDGYEHAGGGTVATGDPAKRAPEAFSDVDRHMIAKALEDCIYPR
jgi:hypothetical protein